MTRRIFLAAASGTLLAESTVTLHAVAAPVLPAQLALPATLAARLNSRAGLVELRTYRDAQVKHALRVTGVRFVEWGDSLLLPFPSLEARARAWTEVTAQLGAGAAYEFSLYRWPISGDSL